MSKPNQYKWLIVVEGNTDKKTYHDLLTRYGVTISDFAVFPAHGKGFVCNAATWNNVYLNKTDLLNTVIQDSGRKGFEGIILLVDSDSNSDQAFDCYQRSPDTRLRYVGAGIPQKENKGRYWFLDAINGVREVPIYGISVPMSSSGCLETELLSSYGFPVEGQKEYTQFVNIIQRAGGSWQIPKHGDGKDWWEENKKSKLDKFIYSALAHGFCISGETPSLPNEPGVISNIKAVIGLS